ncbi:MAG TPA: hypothetical protein VMZ28_12420 [Kofleriaceae bacterium]|nr:hypothetical protein [Kofleriaceae bacterium]
MTAAPAATGLMPLFWVRMAGLPFGWLAELRCPQAAQLAAEVAAADRALEQRATAMAAAIASRFPRGHHRLERAVAARQPLADDQLDGVAAWNDAVAARASLRARLDAAVGPELAAARERLHARMGDARVRGAIRMSAPAADVMFERMRAEGAAAPRASRMRQREVEATLFLQRLCARNETIARHGPLAWGRVAPCAGAMRVAGDGRIAARLVAFEDWAVRAVARAIEVDPALRSDLPLAIAPTCWLEGDVLHYPLGRRRALPPPAVKLLEHAPGRRERDLVAPGGDPATRDALAALERAGVVTRGLPLPTGVSHPEDALRGALARLPPSPARDGWLRELDDLRALRDAFAAAADEAERAPLLAALAASFERITGAPPARQGGAARALLREDCQVDLDVVMSPATCDRLSRALAPLVELCRWIARDVAGGLAARYRDIHAALGGGAVDAVAFAHAARAVEQEEGVVAATRGRVAAAWAAVLRDGGAAPERHVDDAQLAGVLAALPAPLHAGPFPGEHAHAPDLLLEARGRDALERGDLRVVLGEIHKAVYYEAHPVGLPFCPDRAGVVARLAAHADPAAPRLMDAPEHHTSRSWVLPEEAVLDVAVPGTCGRRPERSAPLAAFVVRDEDGTLWLERRDGRTRGPLLGAMQNLLLHWCDRIPPVPAPPGDHLPRLCAGDLVMRRRTWRLEAAALAGLSAAAAPPDMLLAAAALRAARDLPARIYARSPGEPKPVFVDLEAVHGCELLARLARQAPRLEVTECLPDADGLWLELDGERHTSELRLTYALPR